MEHSKIAPLVLRLSRQSVSRGPAISYAGTSASRHFSPCTRRQATPLPPSPDEAVRIANQEILASGVANAGSSSQPPPPSPPPKRSLRPFIWISGFLLVGVTINAVMRAIVFPPPLPAPDTEEDAQLVSRLRSDLNALPIVEELRKDRETWREYDPYSQRQAISPGSSADDAGVDSHLTAGTLRGARGLAIQRSFYNAAEKREISIVFFGGAVSGWPGVTHGGILMTVLKEAIERVANGPGFASRPEDVEVPTMSKDSVAIRRKRLECESLTLDYKRPTQANYFYVIRAEVQNPDSEKPGHTHVKASLENALTTKVGVYAKGYCKRADAVGTVQAAVSNGAGGVWSGIAGLFGNAT